MSDVTTPSPAQPAAAVVPTVVLPPRRTRTKESLTIRESGIVVYGLEKLSKSPVPKIPWFAEMFTRDQIDASTTIAALYAQAAIEEQEEALPELRRIAAATQDEKLKKRVEDIIKNQTYMAEQRSKGKLSHLDETVAFVKKAYSDKQLAMKLEAEALEAEKLAAEQAEYDAAQAKIAEKVAQDSEEHTGHGGKHRNKR